MAEHPEVTQVGPTREALQARITELERLLAEAQKPPQPLDFQALRIIEEGWAAGWELRPSPAKRDWMSQEPFAYQCLPLVVANQWGKPSANLFFFN